MTFLLATNPVVTEAAGQITGKQIKNGSVTGKDIKDRSITAADSSGNIAGPAGPAGPQGPQGKQGPAGDPTGTVPSGKTITGVYYRSNAPDQAYTFNLPVRLLSP